MPTIIAIDCSLSMSRYFYKVETENSKEQLTHKDLAQDVADQLIEHMSKTYKLEYTALLAFSSQVEVLNTFTRDFNALRNSVKKLKLQDRPAIDVLFSYITEFVNVEWGMSMPCDIIIISDGFLKLHTLEQSSLHLPFQFPARLHYLCLASTNDLNYNTNRNMIKESIASNLGRGSLYSLDDHFIEGKSKVEVMVSAFCNEYLNVFKSTLHCGNLSSEIVIFPKPERQMVTHDGRGKTYAVGIDIHIVGFLPISVIKSPPALYRYLILPYDTDADNLDPEMSQSSVTPSFSVVLHGSLKVDNKVAIVRIDEDWYGMISSWADNKKKSNLVLSIFEVGSTSVPSIGDITGLGLMENSGKPIDKNAFPVVSKNTGKRSYAQNGVVWTRPTGLQTDIQKLLRNAKKLPEKTNIFYKELNRIRKAALAFGFLDLLDGISALLERECTLLPGTAHPEAAMQLSHAASELKTVKGYTNLIQPLKTDFKYHK